MRVQIEDQKSKGQPLALAWHFITVIFDTFINYNVSFWYADVLGNPCKRGLQCPQKVMTPMLKTTGLGRWVNWTRPSVGKQERQQSDVSDGGSNSCCCSCSARRTKAATLLFPRTSSHHSCSSENAPPSKSGCSPLSSLTLGIPLYTEVSPAWLRSHQVDNDD